jgi:hypothetical protein
MSVESTDDAGDVGANSKRDYETAQASLPNESGKPQIVGVEIRADKHAMQSD